ncbi:hypothetical protein DN069_23875 [Streptacidiphilus pinicola]|uniref:Uncharacterized protein n=1 Tax=Streptacidiphilus pinicola TaxID=2219663 RepID=A0A2X0K1I5_9ACTN|nr:hypothetical protein DN069_23875 [Streptacidiphilus pinicola]
MRNEAEVGELLHRRGWREAFTVGQMVDNWAWLVAQVELGYEDDVNEYTNDLSCRNWLHEAWLLLDDVTVLRWTETVKALDTRFRAATLEDDGLALGWYHRIPSPELWWWRRHPKHLVGELARHLSRAGVVVSTD